MLHHAQLIRRDDPMEYQHPAVSVEVRYVDHAQVGVDEARALQQIASQTPVEATSQAVVVRTRQLTVEAQNALLKLFEEPPASTQFVLVVPPALLLVPTLLSRLESTGTTNGMETAAWRSFMAGSVEDRLAQIDQWQKQKEQRWLHDLQTGFLWWLKQSTTQPSKTVELVAERLGTRGASNKLLLEALALDEQLQNNE